jgi:XRE family aerobic/anaerobic benzoate catabolism transcriptional regulator
MARTSRTEAAADRAASDTEVLARLGRRVRRARETRGDSRAALAARAGLSPRFLAQLESGTGNISVLRLRDVAAALGLGWAELFARGGAPNGADVPADVRADIDALLEGRTAAELHDVRHWLGERFARPRRGRLVALLGLRGAGKSTVGRRLARGMRVQFRELDRLVESAAGMELEQIFELQGERRYRQLERDTLRRFLATTRAGVLATGGGIVTEPETYELLRRSCFTVWLRARPQEHWDRVMRQGDRRPMAGNPAAMQQLRALLGAREPLYALADVTLETSRRGAEEVAHELALLVRSRCTAPRLRAARRPARRRSGRGATGPR